jgi:hypothetical protein
MRNISRLLKLPLMRLHHNPQGMAAVLHKYYRFEAGVQGGLIRVPDTPYLLLTGGHLAL